MFESTTFTTSFSTASDALRVEFCDERNAYCQVEVDLEGEVEIPSELRLEAEYTTYTPVSV